MELKYFTQEELDEIYAYFYSVGSEFEPEIIAPTTPEDRQKVVITALDERKDPPVPGCLDLDSAFNAYGLEVNEVANQQLIKSRKIKPPYPGIGLRSRNLQNKLV